VLVNVDARYATYQQAVAAPEGQTHLVPTLGREELLKLVVDRRFELDDRLGRLRVRREAGMMTFMVEDKGVGIPKDQQARVLERFEEGRTVLTDLRRLEGGSAVPDLTDDTARAAVERAVVRLIRG